jgi:hypothetical protein
MLIPYYYGGTFLDWKVPKLKIHSKLQLGYVSRILGYKSF